MPVSTPPLIPQPFAESGDRAAIPDTTIAVGRASYDLGFPPITMQPKVAGGVPPDGRDMNGILYALSAHAAYVQAGQPFKYDAAVVAAISGYAVGTLLESTDGTTMWLNVTAGNTTDPDASGAGWIPLSSYGTSSISGLIGGTRTLTSVEARYNMIVLSGALVANQAIVVPNWLRAWRIVNLTTGSFTTTVRTAAGTGVTVPQGGYAAAVGVYGNGTDVFLEVPPVALPIDVAATPDTIAKRDNVGDLFARYFNSSSSPEAFAIGTLMATTGVDGYLRKISFGNFLLQALSNAALTGTPTAPSAPAGTDSTQIATTHFALEAGVGSQAQAWTNVTASRAINTNYTNSTPRPIQVSVSIGMNYNSGFSLLVSGITVGSITSGGNQPFNQTLTAIVPVGATYRVTPTSGSLANLTWVECR